MTNSVLYLAIIGVLAVAVISLMIVAIVVGVRPYTPIIYIDRYNAGIMTIFHNGDMTGAPRYQMTMEHVFSDYKWYVEDYYNLQPTSRMFSTKYDESVTICESVGNHDNCYMLTMDDDHSFVVPGGAKLVSSVIDCYEYANKTMRSEVDFCDVYTYSEGMWVKEVVVDSITEYPVYIKTLSLNNAAIVTETLYLTFNEDKPSDKSKLEANEGVKVYDFRDGEGDAGNGNRYESYGSGSSSYNKRRSVSGKSIVRYLKGMIGIKEKKGLRRSEGKEEKGGDRKETAELMKQIREVQHLPPRGLAKTRYSERRSVRSDKKVKRAVGAIPQSFDGREYWEECESIGMIRDEGRCGSSWAIAAADVMADRYCIDGDVNVSLSPQYLMYCGMNSNGCNGPNDEIKIWEDLMDVGVVTEYCVAYNGHNGVCPSMCDNGMEISEMMKVHPSDYNIPWAQNEAGRVQAIQKEIMENGPVEGFFIVFSDFVKFFWGKNGIYHRSSSAYYTGEKRGVRIIGWGSEGGEDYWLIANSEGTDNPGQGFFRMRRGNNECNIEEQIAAGLYDYDR